MKASAASELESELSDQLLSSEVDTLLSLTHPSSLCAKGELLSVP